jgi:hypothetical protein
LTLPSKNARLALALGFVAFAVWATYILLRVLERGT